MIQPKKRGLGRGLDALLEQIRMPSAPPPPHLKISSKEVVKQIPIQYIKPGLYQPRRVLDPAALHDLSESIKQHGLLQPVLVRATEHDKYEMIAGERRWRAVELAGLPTISAIVLEANEAEAAAIALIENIQRENLNVMEEARALARLIEEFGLTHQQVADSVGKSRTTVTNLLRLIELHEEVQQLLSRGDIEMGHARALLALKKENQLLAARQVVARELSVRETEALVKNWGIPNKMSPKPVKKDPNVQKLETTLSEQLGAVVKITHSSQGKGTVTVYYHSLDELDGILGRISVKPFIG